MTKTLKIITIILISVVSLAILLYVLVNCNTVSAIAESVVKRKTGCDTVISGLHISAGRPFLTVRVSADSVYLVNVQDSITVRARDLEVKARIKKDSIYTLCSTGRNFVRFGSNRMILNDFSLILGMSRKRSKLLETKASLTVGESKFISTLFPIQTRISKIFIEKDTDELFINNLSVQSGTSDININAAASNLDGFISGKDSLEATVSIQSDNLNVNEFLAGIYYGKGDGKEFYSPSDEDDESFIVAEKYVDYPFLIKEIIPLLIPDRIKVSADINVNKARVTILKISDFSAHMDILDKTAKISGCSFGSNLGEVNTTLFYSSPSKDNLLAGADLNLRKLNAKNVKAFFPKSNNISPLLNSLKGEFDCKATMTSQVDTALIPIMKTLKGVVNFQGHNMSITDAGDLRKYTSMLMFRNKNIGKIEDVNMNVIISDNKLKVFPMTLGVDRYLLAMTGSHTFKNMFTYDISIIKSPLPFKFGISLENGEGKSKVKFKLKKPTYLDANLPTYYQEVNSTHNKISRMIDNVLDVGASQTHTNSSHLTKELFDKHKGIKATNISEPENKLRDSVLNYYNNSSLKFQ